MPSKERAGAGDDLFRPVHVGRASGDVVRQIKAAIHDGTLRPGDGLPSERDLTERLGVSRVTVRDALRTLEATGLVEIRVGARGGAFVTVPATDHMGEGLANMLLMSPVSPQDVTETRMIFELGTIPIVCERRTDEDLRALEEIWQRSTDTLASGEFDVGHSAEFHLRLAACTHNPAIELILDSFHGPLLISLTRAKDLAPEMGVAGNVEHGLLIDAIRRRDVQDAHDVLERHLERTRTRLETAATAATGVRDA